jgi:propionyl-CoA synthetase
MSMPDKMDIWNKAIDDICWQQRPSAVLGERDMKANPYLWFPDGKLNTCYNAVDRHALTSPNTIALYWHSAVTNSKKAVTYQQLLTEVKDVAGVLVDHGVRKGDTVVIYMPMILEAVYTMLACARIGAVHSVVFGMCLIQWVFLFDHRRATIANLYYFCLLNIWNSFM